jgi:glycosyltransferase involved in cell wall biosynthesis
MKVIAVIPAYNAEKTIAEVVRRTKKFVSEVIVIDDGSSDNTLHEALYAGASTIRLSRNRGKAHAIREGIKAIKECDAVVFLDADLQHLPEEIPLLVDEIARGADICIGSRFLRGSPANMPPGNKFSNWFARGLIKLVGGIKITDPQCGFRAVRWTKMKELELKAERYAIDHVMILEAAKKGFKFAEVPVTSVYGEEKSHVSVIKDTLRVAYYIARFVFS